MPLSGDMTVGKVYSQSQSIRTQSGKIQKRWSYRIEKNKTKYTRQRRSFGQSDNTRCNWISTGENNSEGRKRKGIGNQVLPGAHEWSVEREKTTHKQQTTTTIRSTEIRIKRAFTRTKGSRIEDTACAKNKSHGLWSWMCHPRPSSSSALVLFHSFFPFSFSFSVNTHICTQWYIQQGHRLSKCKQ